ncbi:MAG: hypothetical protein M1272_02095 [Firmicutes bacterium]|nr:hypothetical protein [Bacillota bacterium]
MRLKIGIATTLALVMTGCGLGYHLSAWNYQMKSLSYHGRVYRVTHTVINLVGSKIGTISYHGMDSGVFDLYSIPGHPIRTALAVRAKQGFLEAVAAAPTQ